ALWAGVAVGSGMLFKSEIALALARAEDLGSAALYLLGALLAGYVALKWWERRRFYKMLRVARVSAEQLRGLLQAEKRPVTVDLRSNAARSLDRRFIPGALEMDLTQIGERLADLPRDRDIVFYC